MQWQIQVFLTKAKHIAWKNRRQAKWGRKKFNHACWQVPNGSKPCFCHWNVCAFLILSTNYLDTFWMSHTPEFVWNLIQILTLYVHYGNWEGSWFVFVLFSFSFSFLKYDFISYFEFAQFETEQIQIAKSKFSNWTKSKYKMKSKEGGPFYCQCDLSQINTYFSNITSNIILLFSYFVLFVILALYLEVPII